MNQNQQISRANSVTVPEASVPIIDTPAPSVKSRKSKHIYGLALVFLMVLILSVSGFLVYRNHFTVGELTKIPVSPTPMPSTASLSVADPVTWNKYESKTLGYSIGYPPTWKVAPADFNIKNLDPNIEYIYNEIVDDVKKAFEKSDDPNYARVFIRTDVAPKRQTYDINHFPEMYANWQKYELNANTIKFVEPGNKSVAFFVTKANLKYGLFINSNSYDVTDFADMIFSSFKIIDYDEIPNPNPEAFENWLSFDDKNLGISFKYPGSSSIANDTTYPIITANSDGLTIDTGVGGADSGYFFVNIFNNPQDLSFLDYLISNMPEDLLSTVAITDISIDNKLGISVTPGDDYLGVVGWKKIYSKSKQGNIIEIVMGDGYILPSLIFSTFKFTF